MRALSIRTAPTTEMLPLLGSHTVAADERTPFEVVEGWEVERTVGAPAPTLAG